MKRRGFTAIELAIVLSISAIVIPAIYLFGRGVEERRAIGLWHFEVADEVRSLSEALKSDRRQLTFAPRGSLHLSGADDCGGVDYLLTPAHALVRRTAAGCGGERTLATHVEALTHVPGGVAVTFALETKPQREARTEVFIAVED